MIHQIDPTNQTLQTELFNVGKTKKRVEMEEKKLYARMLSGVVDSEVDGGAGLIDGGMTTQSERESEIEIGEKPENEGEDFDNKAELDSKDGPGVDTTPTPTTTDMSKSTEPSTKPEMTKLNPLSTTMTDDTTSIPVAAEM